MSSQRSAFTRSMRSEEELQELDLSGVSGESLRNVKEDEEEDDDSSSREDDDAGIDSSQYLSSFVNDRVTTFFWNMECIADNLRGAFGQEREEKQKEERIQSENPQEHSDH